MFDINVIAMLVGSQAAIRVMRETKSQGHIVTISSYAGRGDGYRVYGATKAAINSLCMTLRNELEERVAVRVAELSESEQRFRNMAESSDVLIAIADETSKGIYFNKAWTDLTGKSEKELLEFWSDPATSIPSR